MLPGQAGSGGGTSTAAGAVLLVLASSQFLMTLDTSVMNVSIKSVANDLGSSVTGIQTAITLYTLVMAAFMITGGKVGALLGRRRAFGLGLIVYGCGSLVTAVSPNLTVLLVGWSEDSKGWVPHLSCRPSLLWWPPTFPVNDVRRPMA